MAEAFLNSVIAWPPVLITTCMLRHRDHCRGLDVRWRRLEIMITYLLSEMRLWWCDESCHWAWMMALEESETWKAQHKVKVGERKTTGQLPVTFQVRLNNCSCFHTLLLARNMTCPKSMIVLPVELIMQRACHDVARIWRETAKRATTCCATPFLCQYCRVHHKLLVSCQLTLDYFKCKNIN